jgi:death on curing protein
MTDYLTVAEVLAVHADLIARYGGSPGVRDRGLLESALYRPQTGYYTDLLEEAAALWESLSQNHPLVDGQQSGLPSQRLIHSSPSTGIA